MYGEKTFGYPDFMIVADAMQSILYVGCLRILKTLEF